MSSVPFVLPACLFQSKNNANPCRRSTRFLITSLMEYQEVFRLPESNSAGQTCTIAISKGHDRGEEIPSLPARARGSTRTPVPGGRSSAPFRLWNLPLEKFEMRTWLTKSRNGATLHLFNAMFKIEEFFFKGKRWTRCSKLSIAVEELFPLYRQGRQHFL
jgi:hypothetical protein